ncbi:hypothetical protein KIN_07020 [Litoreibacter roseus]|uniref:DUF3047 family protein n=1 Tax=Litoreibacter roseus TaxID=2601869 RepID=A0A6N6JEB4_9RHOB|nr:hypothetical protein KIN_07020 [Litoreibacter roseus]
MFSSNDYRFGQRSLGVVSDGSVSLAYTRLPMSVWQAQTAQWKWMVDRSVPPTDLAREGGDDRNLALYFVFLPEDVVDDFGPQAPVRKLLQSDDVRVLIYVWGGNASRGAFLESPYLGNRGRTIVRRAASPGSFDEAVDLKTDFRRAFGTDPGALVGLAVSADSDDTDTKIVGEISELRLQ